MTITDLIAPWRGIGWRHIPAGSPFGPLDTRFAARSDQNRWNAAGEPTLYLAGDAGVAIAEFGRHVRVNRNESLIGTIGPRQLFRIELHLERVVDLRLSEVIASLGLAAAPAPFLDREVARATAGFLRHTHHVEAILTPSAAFLDDSERWVMAIFIENLAGDIEDVVDTVDQDAMFEVS